MKYRGESVIFELQLSEKCTVSVGSTKYQLKLSRYFQCNLRLWILPETPLQLLRKVSEDTIVLLNGTPCLVVANNKQHLVLERIGLPSQVEKAPRFSIKLRVPKQVRKQSEE